MANLTIGYQHGQSIRMRFDIGGSTVDSATGAGNSRTRATTEAWINSSANVQYDFSFLDSSPEQVQQLMDVQ